MFLPSNITLKFGDSGDFVAELQRRLAMVRCFNSDAVNGFYDGTTVTAVTSFQGQNGLHADGVAGPETLRRLNGVIAGDTSGAPADTKPEEEHSLVNPSLMVEDVMHTQQQEAAQWHAAAAVEAPAPIAPVDYAPAPLMPMAEPAPRAMDPELTANRVHDQSLAAMLLADLPPPPVQQPVREPVPQELIQPAPQQSAPMFGTAAPAPIAPIQEPQPAAEAAAQQQGLLGKAMRFTNAVMQKLASYMETKLPDSVLKEVQQLGLTMAQNGVKEVPIPGGPEIAPVRDQQIPGRGGEQQQPSQIQRG